MRTERAIPTLALAAALLGAAAAPAAATDPDSVCAEDGDGRGDKGLGALKNRPAGGDFTKVSKDFEKVTLTDPTFAQGHCGTMPKSLPKFRANWHGFSKTVIVNLDTYAACVALQEKRQVCMEGVLTGVKLMGPESVNCHKGEEFMRDYHMWLGDAKGADFSTTIVVEVTPRVKYLYRWSDATLKKLLNRKVRVYGMKLFDHYHREKTPTHRLSSWEIHPVYYIELLDGGASADPPQGFLQPDTGSGGKFPPLCAHQSPSS
jgi:hypothetical protein